MYKRKHWSVNRRQRPIKGGRESLPACVIKEILQAVEKEVMQHKVSKSFVIAVRLAKSYGIDEQEPL
jgi:hypothetical protein